MATICVSYAYPTSFRAQRLKRGKTGCHYFTIARPDMHHQAPARGPYGTAAEALDAARPAFPTLAVDRYPIPAHC